MRCDLRFYRNGNHQRSYYQRQHPILKTGYVMVPTLAWQGEPWTSAPLWQSTPLGTCYTSKYSNINENKILFYIFYIFIYYYINIYLYIYLFLYIYLYIFLYFCQQRKGVPDLGIEPIHFSNGALFSEMPLTFLAEIFQIKKYVLYIRYLLSLCENTTVIMLYCKSLRLLIQLCSTPLLHMNLKKVFNIKNV